MSLKITVLGSGTSQGVPSIGCDCAVCKSPDPRDRRLRPSILMSLPGPEDPAYVASPASAVASAVRHVLVDTSIDLRAQALEHDIRRIDAILFTHSHADHIFGLDEIRRYNTMQRAAIGCYADDRTVDSLRRTFAYIFEPLQQPGGGIPQVTLFRLAGPFTIGGAEIVPIPLLHGTLPILGFRVGSFAYLTDCNRIPDQSWPLLDGVRVIVIDALRERPHSTHFCVAEALAVVERLGVERAYFTHICHDLPHAATCARLPAGVQLAYDGLVIDL
ncbi:MAG: MBL fold metallo-hydrolase [Vicinamibacterales bacterium]